jgi:hypothetical protein
VPAPEAGLDPLEEAVLAAAPLVDGADSDDEDPEDPEDDSDEDDDPAATVEDDPERLSVR